MTDVDGRFVLGGYRQGPAFLFARGDGFRFSGRLVKPGDDDLTVELTRTSERPAREMRMLPDAVTAEESRALGRRLIEPYWEAALNERNVRAQVRPAVAGAPGSIRSACSAAGRGGNHQPCLAPRDPE